MEKEIIVEQPTISTLIHKVTDIASNNKEASIILVGALSLSIILYAIAKSATEIIKAVRE